MSNNRVLILSIRGLIISIPAVLFLSGAPLIVLMLTPNMYFLARSVTTPVDNYLTAVGRLATPVFAYSILFVIVFRIILHFYPGFSSIINYRL